MPRSRWLTWLAEPRQYLVAAVVIALMAALNILALPLIGWRYPGSVHLGRRRLSDFGPEVRERIMPSFTNMMGTMSVLLGLLFSFLLHEIIQAASSSQPHFSPKWELGLFLAGMAVTLIYYLGRIYAVTSENIAGSSSKT